MKTFRSIKQLFAWQRNNYTDGPYMVRLRISKHLTVRLMARH
jgi:hypothetical protein